VKAGGNGKQEFVKRVTVKARNNLDSKRDQYDTLRTNADGVGMDATYDALEGQLYYRFTTWVIHEHNSWSDRTKAQSYVSKVQVHLASHLYNAKRTSIVNTKEPKELGTRVIDTTQHKYWAAGVEQVKVQQED